MLLMFEKERKVEKEEGGRGTEGGRKEGRKTKVPLEKKGVKQDTS